MLEKALDSPFDCKEIKLVHPKGNRPEYSLDGLILKLKLQYSGHLMQRTDSFEKTLMLGKIEGWRRRGDWGWDGWTGSLTQWTWVWANSGRWWRTGKPGVPQSTGLQRVQYYWATEQQQLINVDELKKLSHSTGELSGDAEAVQQWRKKKRLEEGCYIFSQWKAFVFDVAKQSEKAVVCVKNYFLRL